MEVLRQESVLREVEKYAKDWLDDMEISYDKSHASELEESLAKRIKEHSVANSGPNLKRILAYLYIKKHLNAEAIS